MDAKQPGEHRCDAAQRMLCELFDPSTTSARREEIRVAIRQCPECFERMNSEAEVRAVLRRCTTTERAPGYLRKRIVTQIRITRG